MPSLRDIGAIRKILIPLLRRLLNVKKVNRARVMTDALRKEGISPNRAVRALAGKRADIGVPSREVALETLTSSHLTAELGTPTLTEVRALAGTTGTTRATQLLERFTSKQQQQAVRVAQGVAPVSTTAGAAPAAQAGTLRTLLPTLRAIRKRRQVAGRDITTQRDFNVAAAEMATTAGDIAGQLQKAAGPRRGRAAVLAGGGLVAGLLLTRGSKKPSKQTQALIADLVLNQQQKPDRQELLAAQTELTKARTAAILHKILSANVEAQSPTIPFT